MYSINVHETIYTQEIVRYCLIFILFIFNILYDIDYLTIMQNWSLNCSIFYFYYIYNYYKIIFIIIYNKIIFYIYNLSY